MYYIYGMNDRNGEAQSCILMWSKTHSDSEPKAIFLMKNIAVVGMSKNEEKAGHFVPKYLIEQGLMLFR